MNEPVLVDTSAWIAIISPRDRFHLPAKSFYGDILAQRRPLLISNLVVAETYIHLRQMLGHQKATSFLDLIERSSLIRCVWSDRELETRARDILRRYGDQDFSYTDAVSFALMQQLQLTDAFAFDRHFSTAGFVQLPPQQ